jgi:hypothetical protein
VLWVDVGLNVAECCGGGLQQIIDNRHDGRILSREVAFKVSWRYVGRAGDLIHGGGVPWLMQTSRVTSTSRSRQSSSRSPGIRVLFPEIS